MLLKHCTSEFISLFSHSQLIDPILTFATNLFVRFIRPEDVPVQYGGLSRPNDLQKPASEFTVKGGEKVNIQIEGIEVSSFIALS